MQLLAGESAEGEAINSEINSEIVEIQSARLVRCWRAVNGSSKCVISAYFKYARGVKTPHAHPLVNAFTVSGPSKYKSEPCSQLKWWSGEPRFRLKLKHAALQDD